MTMSALVLFESGGRPFAIGDNTTHRSYYPSSRDDASTLAAGLIAAGHDLDLGYAQINVTNLTAYGLDVRRAFDPCLNVAAGSLILLQAYAAAIRRFGSSPPPLAQALSAYNSGRFSIGLGYAAKVFASAVGLRRPHETR
jgi:type IV secretion system protein VirB1